MRVILLVICLSVVVTAKYSSINKREEIVKLLKKHLSNHKRQLLEQPHSDTADAGAGSDDSAASPFGSNGVDTTGWIHLFQGCYLSPSFPFQLDESVSFTVSFDADQQAALQKEIDSFNFDKFYEIIYPKPSSAVEVTLWPGCTLNYEVLQNIEPIVTSFMNPCSGAEPASSPSNADHANEETSGPGDNNAPITGNGAEEPPSDGETSHDGTNEGPSNGETSNVGANEGPSDDETSNDGANEGPSDGETSNDGANEESSDSETSNDGANEESSDSETSNDGANEESSDSDETKEELSNADETNQEPSEGKTSNEGTSEQAGSDTDEELSPEDKEIIKQLLDDIIKASNGPSNNGPSDNVEDSDEESQEAQNELSSNGPSSNEPSSDKSSNNGPSSDEQPSHGPSSNRPSNNEPLINRPSSNGPSNNEPSKREKEVTNKRFSNTERSPAKALNTAIKRNEGKTSLATAKRSQDKTVFTVKRDQDVQALRRHMLSATNKFR